MCRIKAQAHHGAGFDHSIAARLDHQLFAAAGGQMQERHAAKRFGHLDAVGACMGVNLQMLRAQTKGQRRAQRRQPDRDRQRAAKPSCINLTRTADPCRDEVHRGRADKACNACYDNGHPISFMAALCRILHSLCIDRLEYR